MRWLCCRCSAKRQVLPFYTRQGDGNALQLGREGRGPSRVGQGRSVCTSFSL